MSIADKLTTVAENTEKVYKAGIDNRDLFIWNALNSPSRNTYMRAFAYTDFSDYTFIKPVKPETLDYIFYSYFGESLPGNIDFSKVSPDASTLNAFGYARQLKILPDIGIPAMNAYKSTFNTCRALERIEVLRVGENTTFSGCFAGCYRLKSITIEGEIGQNGFDLSAGTVLSKESIINIIEHLSGNAIDKSITLNKSSTDNAFGTESLEWLELIGTKPNWTINLI